MQKFGGVGGGSSKQDITGHLPGFVRRRAIARRLRFLGLTHIGCHLIGYPVAVFRHFLHPRIRAQVFIF